MPKETIYIDCVEVEISPDNWIMAVTAELEEEAYEEMRNNK